MEATEEGTAQTKAQESHHEEEQQETEAPLQQLEEPHDDSEDDEDDDLYAHLDAEERVAAANAEKDEGNRRYAEGKYGEAVAHYTQALRLAPPRHTSCAVFYSNRAACHLAQDKHEEVIKDATEALRIDAAYVKALMRRAQAYEATSKLAEALKDYEAALALDGSLKQAREAKQRLPAAITEQQQREQEKMLGQLKDLGNSLLGKFGLSLDNFKVEKDNNNPSGGYSVKFG